MSDSPLIDTLPKSILNKAYKYAFISSSALYPTISKDTFVSIAAQSQTKKDFAVNAGVSTKAINLNHVFSGDGMSASDPSGSLSAFISKFGGLVENGQVSKYDFGERLDISPMLGLNQDLRRFGRFVGDIYGSNSNIKTTGSTHHVYKFHEPEQGYDKDETFSFSNKEFAMLTNYGYACPYMHFEADQFNFEKMVSTVSAASATPNCSIVSGIMLAVFYVSYHNNVNGTVTSGIKYFWKFITLPTYGRTIPMSSFTEQELRSMAVQCGAIFPDEQCTGSSNTRYNHTIKMQRGYVVFTRDGVR